MKTAAVIVAAGRGVRMASKTPKQYRALGGTPLLARTLARFDGHDKIGCVQVVIHADDRQAFETCRPGFAKLRAAVVGGATRQASVLAGLEALEPVAPKYVLVHDAARPFVPDGVIDTVIGGLKDHPCVVPVLPVFDTIKQVEGAIVTGTPDRSALRAAQTPQGFAFDALLDAHRRATAHGIDDLSDDAAIAQWAGLEVVTVAGDGANWKITTPEDLARARLMYGAREHAMETRTGQGFDVHRFGDGDRLFLCGVEIPHDFALEGHSDADVALHALTDALLGAIGERDIGSHFPPSDPKWKGAPSAVFVTAARDLIARRSGVVANVDLTIICEQPRIGPHRDAMTARIADLLGIDIIRVNVKATTSEGLGFTGRGEGIAASAIATVRLPVDGADPLE